MTDLPAPVITIETSVDEQERLVDTLTKLCFAHSLSVGLAVGDWVGEGETEMVEEGVREVVE